jgi:transcriptional regulator with XRE-family HTH domain
MNQTVAFMGFRENLKEELTYQDMLVKELAELTGVSRHTLDNYLNARRRMPTVDVAVKIAQALGVSVEYLVLGEDKQEPPPIGVEVRALVQNYKQLSKDYQKMITEIIQLFKKQKTRLTKPINTRRVPSRILPDLQGRIP